MVFANPFAFLAVWAAKAHDSVAVFILLAILFTAFAVSYKIVLRQREKSMKVVRVIPIAFFPLLLITTHARWEMWTGRPPWQYPSDALTLVAIGFLLFAFYIIHWLIIRDS